MKEEVWLFFATEVATRGVDVDAFAALRDVQVRCESSTERFRTSSKAGYALKSALILRVVDTPFHAHRRMRAGRPDNHSHNHSCRDGWWQEASRVTTRRK